MSVFKGPRWQRSRCFDVQPYFKPSQRSPILMSTSSHTNSVYVSWPLSRFRDFEMLSSSPHYAMAAKRQFLQKVIRQQPSHPAIPFLQSSLVPIQSGSTAKSQVGSWLVLPYHLAWLPLVATVRTIAAHWDHLYRAYGRLSLSLVFPRISWARGNKFLMQVLYKEPRREE